MAPFCYVLKDVNDRDDGFKTQIVPIKKQITQVMTISDVDFDSNEKKLTEKPKTTEGESETEPNAEEWKVLSNVVNVLNFYLTSSVLIIGTAVIFSEFQKD